MLVKFIARGTGSAQMAAAYLTRELDSQGAVRADVAVLRGDPAQVAAVADALAFTHTYTSGVIAWAPEDEPSAAQIDRVLDEFEKTAWAGLAPGRERPIGPAPYPTHQACVADPSWKWQGEKGPCGNVKMDPSVGWSSRRVPINAFSSVERGPSGSVGRP